MKAELIASVCRRRVLLLDQIISCWLSSVLYKTMTDRFSESQMLRLVEVYRDYECLWNVTSELYKNKEARQIAYKQIFKRLNIPGLTQKDIPKKIKNLRSSYCQELKKIENSLKPGASPDSVYEPKVSWFTVAESYLKPFIKRQEIFSNDPLAFTPGEVSSYLQVQINPNLSEKEDLLVERSMKLDIKQENESEEENFEEDNKSNIKKICFENIHSLNDSSSSLSNRSSKHDNTGIKDQDLSQVIAKIDRIANNITKCTNTLTENKEDEFDIFGRYMAKILRAMPKEISIVAKLAIQKAVSDIQLKAMRKDKNTQQASLSTADAFETK